MKRSLCFLLILSVVFLAGCEIPVKNISDDLDNTTSQEKSLEELTIDNEGTKAAEESQGSNNAKPVDKPKLAVTLYYQDADGYIIPVTRRVAKQEGIAKAAVNGLIDSSVIREEIEYYGLYPVLPKGTQILGMTIKEGIATIDFNKQLLNYDNKTAERNIITSIVYTLTEFKTIQGVKILVNGYTQEKLKFGTDASVALNRENILINSEMVNLKEGMKKFDAYLLKSFNDKFSYILPVSIESSNVEDQNLPEEIIDVLSNGYDNESLLTEFPSGVELLGSSVKSGVITLDLNSEIVSYGGGTAREEAILKQILFSMKQIKGINSVKIKIDGEEGNLPEGSDISKPISIPVEINDYIDKVQ